jgi:hypothetical protein
MDDIEAIKWYTNNHGWFTIPTTKGFKNNKKTGDIRKKTWFKFIINYK